MVQQEIECKAHVNEQDFFRLQKKLKTLCSNTKPIYKQDTYYMFSNNVGIRLRQHNNTLYILSFKEKYIENGIEKNIEHETQVQDSQVIDTIFRQLNPKKCIKKVKTGFFYVLERKNIPIIVELIEVLGLGYFIEMEYNSEIQSLHNSSPLLTKDTTEAIKSVLLTLLHELQITEEAIEPRYYIDMLQEV